ncbi:MAG: hypothetical protein K0Q90_321 [Paenibacillaceae bacterium]|nr:hypothetical protein [Paenibacillaceae bacterium]
MSLPIVLAKSLLSLTLLSAAAPAGGEMIDAFPGKGEAGGVSAGSVHVTRAVAAYDGTNVTKTVLATIPDPLELAKTYAPETVEEWTRTLEQCKETAKLQVYRVHLNETAEGEAEGNVTLPVEIAIQAMPAVRLDAEAEAAPDEASPKHVSVEIRQAVVLEDAALEGVEPFSVPPVMRVVPLDEGIVKAQTAVAKALEAGGKDEIRAALQQLLTAYQSFLAEK